MFVSFHDPFNYLQYTIAVRIFNKFLDISCVLWYYSNKTVVSIRFFPLRFKGVHNP